MSETETECDHLFILFGVYGDVQVGGNDTTLEFLILCHVAAGEDSVQQEGHRPDPDGGAPAGHAGHQPPRQVQAVGKGDQNLVPGCIFDILYLANR